MLNVRVDVGRDIDFGQCSQLFQASYQNEMSKFTPEYFNWRYTQCFGDETVFVGLHKNGVLIGQAVIFIQRRLIEGRVQHTGQLGDLVVHPNHRSIAAVRAIYKSLKSQIVARAFDLIFTLPNSKSAKLNQRFLGMKSLQPLLPLLTIGWPLRSKLVTNAAIFVRANKDSDALDKFGQRQSDRVIMWDNQTFERRLKDPTRQFAFVTTDHCTMITSPHKTNGISTILVMGVFCADKHKVRKNEWDAMISASTRLFRNPFHIHVGNNSSLDGNIGFKAPFWANRMSKQVQVLNLHEKSDVTQLPNLELIDLDIY